MKFIVVVLYYIITLKSAESHIYIFLFLYCKRLAKVTVTKEIQILQRDRDR